MTDNHGVIVEASGGVCQAVSQAADADWLDNMILVGRMYIGEAPSDHTRACLAIQSDRMAFRLIQRLRLKARAACQ